MLYSKCDTVNVCVINISAATPFHLLHRQCCDIFLYYEHMTF